MLELVINRLKSEFLADWESKKLEAFNGDFCEKANGFTKIMQKNKILPFLFILQSSLFVNLRRYKLCGACFR